MSTRGEKQRKNKENADLYAVNLDNYQMKNRKLRVFCFHRK